MGIVICSNNTNKLSPQERGLPPFSSILCSNNTNKLSPQEQESCHNAIHLCSNNTNKLSPQELLRLPTSQCLGSNNTNKLSPQERPFVMSLETIVQIIQINLVLKNSFVRKCLTESFK